MSATNNFLGNMVLIGNNDKSPENEILKKRISELAETIRTKEQQRIYELETENAKFKDIVDKFLIRINPITSAFRHGLTIRVKPMHELIEYQIEVERLIQKKGGE